MSNMQWRDAILRVLGQVDEPMHYTEIAQAVIDQGLRRDVGATPSSTVASFLGSDALKDQIVKTERGYYILPSKLRSLLKNSMTSDSESDEIVKEATRVSALNEPSAVKTATDPLESEAGLIGSFGMFWHRNEVDWRTPKVRLLGVQLTGGDPIDFSEQAGIYLLHEGNRVIYVGRVTESRLGARLWEHTRDRLKARWDKFSWFGVRSVGDDGKLGEVPPPGMSIEALIATMEALMIEGLEPPQNRRQGDGFKALEFIQEVDPAIENERKRRLWHEVGKQFR